MDTGNNNDECYGNYDFDVATETSKRPMCSVCMRAAVVCWCSFLPEKPIKTKSTVLILQHLDEQSHSIKTALMLEKGLEKGRCTIIRGIQFDECDILEKSSKGKLVLMYPAPDAEDLTKYVAKSHRDPCTLILLDGTWKKAQSLYRRNEWLWKINKVKVTPTQKSRFIIRRQPNEHCLSTVESGALALSILEERPEIMQILTQPLIGMCDLQKQKGAGAYQHDETPFDCGQVKPNKKWYDLPPKRIISGKNDDGNPRWRCRHPRNIAAKKKEQIKDRSSD